jgi:Tol biopolymer transport system component
VGSATRAGAPATARSWRQRITDPVVLILALVATAAVAALVTRGDVTATPEVPPIRFGLSAPEGASLRLDMAPWPVAISRDGSKVAFSAIAGGEPGLWLLETNALVPRLIPGTEGATQQPIFSPDGEWLLYQLGNQETKIRLDGGKPVELASDGNANGVDWISADDIVYGASGPQHGLSIVSATGSARRPLTTIDAAGGVTDHLWPIVAPDGETIAFTLWKGSLPASELALTTVGSGKVTPLGLSGIRPLAFLDGYLVYVQHDGAVMAIAIDLRGLKSEGRPIQVHDRVRVETANNGNSGIFISPGGALAVSEGNQTSRLAWRNAQQSFVAISADSKPFMEPRISPDGARIAVMTADGGVSDIWMYDLRQGTLSRLTSVGSVSSATWVDPTHIVYAAAGKTARIGAWLLDISGGRPAELLVETPGLATGVSLSPDGRTVYFQTLVDGIWRVVQMPRGSTGSGVPVTGALAAGGTASASAGRLSPNGKFLSFSTTQTGRQEVYVHSLAGDSATIQVSAGGGRESAWSADGTKLYYQAGTRIVAARLSTTPRLSVVSRDTVFSLDGAVDNSSSFGSAWDIATDGRLLVLQTVRAAQHFVISPNWITEFRARIAAATK